ncbi:diguanylate cyclase [Alloalcanivorax sp. C16-2]|uniref:GGDEF domain-containing protein n=1 Tax=Alloalcanivorax TaxID=3020832 RepID=UPI0019338E89|nr:GGDEF domain-containing protein [Alloalcanivorax marinus]MBL7251076.1 GGDEF domain-containing protein [Alloalcanivorax marinus]
MAATRWGGDHNGESQRRALLKALLIITALCGVLFFVINSRRGVMVLAYMELGAAVASLALYVVARRTRRLLLWTLLYLIPFLTIMMVALYIPGSSPTVFLWVYIVPVLCHLLLGQRLGLAVSVFYILVALFLFLHKNPDYLYRGQFAEIANITLSLAVTLAFAYIYELSSHRSRSDLMVMASTDPLTRLANLYRFREAFEHEKRRALRLDSPLSVLVLDLDHFKAVNDTHGHKVGDLVLIHVAQRLRERLRATDLPCRVGGEEFTVLLPDTDRKEAVVVAETLRELIECQPYRGGRLVIPLSCSIGVAEWGTDGDTIDELVEAADQRLYIAKQQGRNQVVASG